MLKQRRGSMWVVAVVVISLISSGCLGRFAAFNKLSDWNQKVTPNKFVNEVVFLAFHIVPVYPLAAFADAIVFNSLEFWTGSNPMTAESDTQKVTEAGNLKVVQTFHQNQVLKIMEAKYYVEGDLNQTLTLSQQAGSPEFNGVVRDLEGNEQRFVIRAEEAKVSLIRFTPEGHPTVEVIEGSALASLTENVARRMDRQPVHVALAH